MTKVRDAILGLVVGDAIGVPVEFQSRDELDFNPVVDMREYGTYHQPKGTWSDDSSLTFCLADNLINGYNLKDLAQNFVDWKTQAKWTPHGEVFDIGDTTRKSINELKEFLDAGQEERLKLLKYESDEFSNGNGALMRILPLYFYLERPIEKQFDTIWEVAALTHRHIRSAISCLIYLIMADEIVQQKNLLVAYQKTQERTKIFFDLKQLDQKERNNFDRLIENDITLLERDAIESSGYVMHSLEASFWCLLKHQDYRSTILSAVNLGEDTDTTAAIAGGLAGLCYGANAIPQDWLKNIVKLREIEDMCAKLNDKIFNS